jgi:hypothetical protein
MARLKSVCNPTPPEGCWIRYQLDVRNIKLDDVARKACRHFTLVSKVIRGERKSEKVQAALAELLGYPSWNDLWADAFISTKRNAV